MSPRDDDLRPGETRAERRRRLAEAQWQGTDGTWEGPHQPVAPGPYDPHPYGVQAYPDIEDAVVEEYVEDPPPVPGMSPYGTPPVAYVEDMPPYGVGSGHWAGVPPTPQRIADPGPWTEPEPSRHVAHRAYGGPPQQTPAVPATPADEIVTAQIVEYPDDGPVTGPGYGAAPPKRGEPASGGGGGGGGGAAGGQEAGTGAAPLLGTPPPERSGPGSATAATAEAPGEPATRAGTRGAARSGTPADARAGVGGAAAAPLDGLGVADDPAATAAALQLIAAQAAAARLGPRRAIAGPNTGPNGAPNAGPTTGSTGRPGTPGRTARTDKERLAAERMAADKLAAAKRAAVRSAAAQQAAATTTQRAQTPAANTARRPAEESTPRTSPTVTDTDPRRRAAGAGSSPGVGKDDAPAGKKRRGWRGRGADEKAPGGKNRKKDKDKPPAPPWARIVFPAAAVAVLAAGIALSVPHLGALSTLSPGASPTSAPSGESPSPAPSTSPTGDASTTATGSGMTSAMACDPGQWAGKLTDEPASKEFTASAVAQAYCLTAGTVRDIGFTDLAVRRPAGKPYKAEDFTPIAAYLSPDLRAQWTKDAAELVRTQDVKGDSGRRISALTRLAWDNSALSFDSAAKSRASDFAVGRPVTWTAKGGDGVTRLGVGFETGIVTHMVDSTGRRQDHILKRTYKIALVKAEGAHPWLIDAYEVKEQTAALSTATVSPSPSGSPTTATTRS